MEVVSTEDIEVKAASENVVTGDRCYTLLLKRFPYTLIQELGTHRVLGCSAGDCSPFSTDLSRNSGSSRAIPVTKVIDQVKEDPFIPTFTKACRGMGGIEEFSDFDQFNDDCARVWLDHRDYCIEKAHYFLEKGVHKQHINDLLKPFMRIPIIITATQWDNFFRLRLHSTCRVEFRRWVEVMKKVMDAAAVKPLDYGSWHIPFSEGYEDAPLDLRLQVSVARCARLSYASHSGDHSLEKDIELYGRLLKEGHMSPFEHQTRADKRVSLLNTRNLTGFVSYRAIVEAEQWLTELRA